MNFDLLVEQILAEKHNATCTKVTGQQSSTRKDKKYMRCVRVNGKLKRIHYGDPNLRIKKSNPKKRKSFRARHKCSTAKPGTPKYSPSKRLELAKDTDSEQCLYIKKGDVAEGSKSILTLSNTDNWTRSLLTLLDKSNREE